MTQKSHLRPQKIRKKYFLRYLFCTFPAILRPLQTPYALGGTSKPLKSRWEALLKKSKKYPKSVFLQRSSTDPGVTYATCFD